MQRGIVTAQSGLRLRRAPGDGDTLRVLPPGTMLDILGGDTWLHVGVDGDAGFVDADHVELLPTEAHAEGEATGRIRPYQNSEFIGGPMQADVDFAAALDRLNQYARECGVKIRVTNAFRRPDDVLRGTVVPPAQRSNHLVGHAIDMNLQSASGSFNSQALRKENLPHLPAEIRQFIDMVRADAGLRWGGDFNIPDPVHIDDGLNLRQPDLWERKFAAL